MWGRIWKAIERFFLTPYHPNPEYRDFLSRAQTQSQNGVEVTVAVPDMKECDQILGVSLASRGLQPVYIRIRNDSSNSVRLQFRSVDPHYFAPLEAAARCHFSMAKRLGAFGVAAWFFLPLLGLLPLKLISAHWANRRIDTLFQQLGLHRRPIVPGQTVEGFIYASLDAGTKIVQVSLMVVKPLSRDVSSLDDNGMTGEPPLVSDGSSFSQEIHLTFSVTLPSLTLDYEHRQLQQRTETGPFEDCDLKQLIERLRLIPAVTTNRRGSGSGDPVNLVIIGGFQSVLLSFVGRWDETEAITLSTCWKTARAFLFGTEYRYSPVSSLYLFGRCQDIALQQIRQSINVRMHLRLWLSSLRFRGHPVWVGQISRDIGVRLTPRTWNLTTHRIDPDIDESRDFLLEDLLDAERVEAAGHVVATDPVTLQDGRSNLTGDPYYTDGKRVVILLHEKTGRPRFVEWN